MSRPQDSAPIPGSTRAALKTAKLVGKSDAEKMIQVSIYARRNPQHAIEAASLPDQIGSQLPKKREHVTGSRFTELYGADANELEKIASWAKQSGLKVVDNSQAHRRVIVEGRTGDIEKAFGLQLLRSSVHPKKAPVSGDSN